MDGYYVSNKFLCREMKPDLTNKIIGTNYECNWDNNGMNNAAYDQTPPQNTSTLLPTTLNIDNMDSFQQDHSSLVAQTLLKRGANIDVTFQAIQEMPHTNSMQPCPNSPESFNESNCYSYPSNFDASPFIPAPSNTGNCSDERLIIFDNAPTPITPSTGSPNSILYNFITSDSASFFPENSENIFSANYSEVDDLTSLLDLSMSAGETQVQPSDHPPIYATSTTKLNHMPSTASNLSVESASRHMLPIMHNSEMFADVQPTPQYYNPQTYDVPYVPTSPPKLKHFKDHREEYFLSNNNIDALTIKNEYHTMPRNSIISQYESESMASHSQVERSSQALPVFYSMAQGNSCTRTTGSFDKSECFAKNIDENNACPSPSLNKICSNNDPEFPLDLRGEAASLSIDCPKKDISPVPKRKSKRIVKNRINLNDSISKGFSCIDCKLKFPKRSLLVKHVQVSNHRKPLVCKHCSYQFFDPATLNVHLRIHTGEKPFKCKYCGEKFICVSVLNAHKRKHTGEKPYECNECGKTFRLLSTLKSHHYTHTGQKPFECEECGARFTQKSALRRHRTSHSNLRPFVCEKCGVSFRIKSIYDRHLKNHILKSKHTCTICGEGFNNNKRLQFHQMRHNSGDKPFKCNKCASEFKSLKYLHQHKRRAHDHNEEIRCEECNASFKRKERYRLHIRVHKGDSLLPCSVCKANFNNAKALKNHKKRHENSKNPRLKQNKASLTASKVTTEKSKGLDINKPNEPFIKCDICHSTFFRTRQYKAHQKSCTPSESVMNCDTSKQETPSLTQQENSQPGIHSDSFSKEEIIRPPELKRQLTPSDISSQKSLPLSSQNVIAKESYHSENDEGGLLNCLPLLLLNKESNAYKLLSAVFEVTDKETTN